MCWHAFDLLKEFHDENKKVPWMVVRSSDSRWKPSASGMYKINFNGAFFEEQA